MGKGEVRMFYLIVMLVMPGTLVKSNSATDLTSPVDDQYPWSALAQRKGPTVQDTLELKWTATDRSEKRPIDRLLQSPWKKSPELQAEHYSKSPSGQRIEDQGPGSMEIYRLTNLDDANLYAQPLPPWTNPIPHKKLMKNKSSKVVHEEYKKLHKPGMRKKFSPLRETQTTHKERKDNDSVGVPELQIGCEGLEAPIEPFSREPRSISVKNESSQEYAHAESEVPPVLPVHPVTIDWDYNEDDQPRHYEDMDELVKLKNLEMILNKKIKHRGDMRPEQDSDVEFDLKKMPLRGDLVGGRKVRSILDKPVSSKASSSTMDGLWGFGENDGYISGDEDESDNERVQTVAERKRQEYLKLQREEMEKRRREQLVRQRNQENRRNDNQINSEIERIHKEYEMRLSAEQRDQERKLKDYIERNRPIVVDNREERDRRVLDEFRRTSGANGYNNPPGRAHGRSRGPSPPITYPSSSRVDDTARRWEAEQRRRQEEYQRRKEGELRREEEERRRRIEERQQAYNQTSNPRETLAEQRRRMEESRRADEWRRELERRKEMQNQSNNNPYRRPEEWRKVEEKMTWERENGNDEEENRRNQARLREEERRRRVMEEKQKRWDDARLNSLPVSARIILVPNSSVRSSTSSPFVHSRGNFDDDDNVQFSGINPNRPGLSAGRFPAALTPRPPRISPSPCVWAVVQCCPNSDQRRLNSCFEYLGCPGVNWDPNPCASAHSDAARAQVAEFYESANQP
ncbi:calponin homology domain-containing protein DDB_G0272472-like isoform X2 [Diachasmimorpha longicaudata]|uniref:calponin homology domain-containing protein DDB_G0272472-like isoform X2 n=1 Tax=Diachasmimorpha longicaudata TaxID=58733 RepID=UPI0030B8D573